MTKKEIRTDHAPAPKGAYSQGVVANGFVYTAGLGPQDPATGTVVATSIEEQTAQVMRNLRAVLEGHDLTLADVVKVTAHLERLDRDFPGFDATYRSFLGEPPYPVRTTVGSTLANILVEIDVVAAVPGG